MVKPRSVAGDKAKEQVAAQLVAVSKGKLKVPDAMKIAGIETPLRSNDSLRRRVHRESRKLSKKEIVFKDPGAAEAAATAPPPESVEVTVGDPQSELLLAVEQRNDMACTHLNGQGYDGEQLRNYAPKKAPTIVTVPHSMERIRAIQKATTAGQHHFATGGAMINSNDFFEAKEWENRDKLIAELEKRKASSLEVKKPS